MTRRTRTPALLGALALTAALTGCGPDTQPLAPPAPNPMTVLPSPPADPQVAAGARASMTADARDAALALEAFRTDTGSYGPGEFVASGGVATGPGALGTASVSASTGNTITTSTTDDTYCIRVGNPAADDLFYDSATGPQDTDPGQPDKAPPGCA